MVQRTVVMNDTVIRFRPDKWEPPNRTGAKEDELTNTRAGRRKRRKMQRQALGGCYFFGIRCFSCKRTPKAKVADTLDTPLDPTTTTTTTTTPASGPDGAAKHSVRSALQERQQLLLVIACADGRYQAASALIDEKGCPPNEPDEEGEYPMCAAVRLGG